MLTKALFDEVMRSLATPALQPTTLLVSPYQKSVFTVYRTADAEAWNWRRIKRELRRIGLTRKGVRREYHKRG